MEPLGRERVTGPWRQLCRVFPSPPAGQILAACLAFGLPLLLAQLLRPVAGLSWQHVDTTLLDKGVTRIVARPMGHNTSLYAFSAGGELYWSGNDGQKWFHMNQNLGRPPLEQREAIDLAVDPEDAKIINAVIGTSFAFPQPMIYWTVDMGLNWQPRSSLGQERVRAISHGPTRNELYVITNTDLLKAMVLEGRSNNTEALQESFAHHEDNLYWVSIAPFEADTWVTSFVAYRLPAKTFPVVDSIGGQPMVLQGDEQAEVLYIGTQDKGLQILVHTAQGTFRPTDTGQDAASLHVLRQATIYTIAVDPRTPMQIYVGTNEGLYTSENGGRHWAALGKHTLNGPILAFLCDTNSRDTMYAGTSQKGVLVSENGGQTWKPLGRGLQRAHVDALAVNYAAGSRTLYAGTRNGLWRLDLEP